jgi:adenylosuccinate lyase
MIPRYDRPEISELWTEEAKFKAMLKAELAILQALEEAGRIPVGTSAATEKGAVINPARIAEIEATTRHDVIAFCTSVTEKLSPEVAKFFHFGVTSSDIIDTGMTLQIRDSLDLILPAFKDLLHSLLKRANEMKPILCMGRSHGMYAEPMSMGQKLLGHYNEFSRRYRELLHFRETELTAQFSGAVGSFTIISPEIEAAAAKKLGLHIEALSTQVLPRDRVAKLIQINALIASAIERFAVEIRHLHRSDVNELHEGFAKGQKGSSTMPHKKNPIAAENLTGMARVLRSHTHIALDNIVLWHERDISHSSAERLFLPDNFGILFYALKRLKSTIDGLEFHTEEIEKRVQAQSVHLSSFFLHHLIEHSSCRREELYPLVQAASFTQKGQSSPEGFASELARELKEKNITVTLPSPSFDSLKSHYLKTTEAVFNRSLKEYPLP